jgi:hypothetical protein
MEMKAMTFDKECLRCKRLFEPPAVFERTMLMIMCEACADDWSIEQETKRREFEEERTRAYVARRDQGAELLKSFAQRALDFAHCLLSSQVEYLKAVAEQKPVERRYINQRIYRYDFCFTTNREEYGDVYSDSCLRRHGLDNDEIIGIPRSEAERWVRIWRRVRGRWGEPEPGSFAWWVNAYAEQEDLAAKEAA